MTFVGQLEHKGYDILSTWTQDSDLHIQRSITHVFRFPLHLQVVSAKMLQTDLLYNNKTN